MKKLSETMSIVSGVFPRADQLKLDEILGGKDASRIWREQYEAQPQEPSMKLWYLAHPVREDDIRSFDENLKHALKMQKILWGVGFEVINPWYTSVLLYGPGEEEVLQRAIEFDCAVIERCDGLILTGHKLSSGMDIELRSAIDFGKNVVNLIGLPDAIVQTLAHKYSDL